VVVNGGDVMIDNNGVGGGYGNSFLQDESDAATVLWLIVFFFSIFWFLSGFCVKPCV
jgi:hypothetical protein